MDTSDISQEFELHVLYSLNTDPTILLAIGNWC